MHRLFIGESFSTFQILSIFSNLLIFPDVLRQPVASCRDAKSDEGRAAQSPQLHRESQEVSGLCLFLFRILTLQKLDQGDFIIFCSSDHAE